MGSSNSQSRSTATEPEERGAAEPRALACAYLMRELDLGLEFAPAPRAEAVERLCLMAAAVPTGTPSRARAKSEPSSAERPVVAELSELVGDADVRESTTLDRLREVLGDCSRCKLAAGRTNIVFGVGNPDAELMFVGEGPGRDEDEQGIPFVGRAGQLLTDIITKGMGLSRDDVYIANIVKCRPPKNRDPEPDEIVSCEPFLHRQIAIIRPRVIVTLGRLATQVLLKNRTPISKQRGRWHDYQGVPVMATYHPAYLLRTPSDKKVVWGDIKLVMERLGLALPPATS